MGSLEAALLPVRGLSFWWRGRWAGLLCQGHGQVHQHGWGAECLMVASRQAGSQVRAVPGCIARAWHCQQSRVALSRGLRAKARAVDPIEVLGCEVSGAELALGRSLAPGSLPLPVLSQQRGLCVFSSLERASYRFPSYFLNSEEKPLWQDE